ncbi:MAG: CopG family ribbon-helix-helix protein [Methylococcales bacterium]
MRNRIVTAHIPLDLADQIDRLAARIDPPKDWIVRQALTAWVQLEGKRHQLTLDGLADADAGRVVDHASVGAWAKSLDQPE